MQFQRVATLGLAAIASLILSSTGAFAQASSSGSIAGVVRDTTGAVLPGVTVEAASPALIEKTRSVVTDGSGAYKIVDLRPGTYSVTFTLTGFSTVKREGIELTSAFTANVNADMKVGSVEETITVTGASPIVDTQNVVQKQTASREVMDVAADRPQLRQLRGDEARRVRDRRVAERRRVGARDRHEPRRPRQPRGGQPDHGGRHVDHQRQRQRRPAVRQLPEQLAGAGNHVSDRGQQRRVRAGVGRFRTSSRRRASNVVPRIVPVPLHQPVAREQQPRRDADLPGTEEREPRQQDLGHQPRRPAGRSSRIGCGFTAATVTGARTTTSPGRSRTRASPRTFYSCNPDPAGNCTTEQNLFPVWHQSAAARLTTQVAPKHKVNLYYDWQFTNFGNCFVPSLLTAISACPEYKNIPQYIVQGSWSSPVSNKLLLEAGGTLTAQDFHGFRQPGRAGNAVPVQRSARRSGPALSVGLVRPRTAPTAATSRTTARRPPTSPARTAPRSA